MCAAFSVRVEGLQALDVKLKAMGTTEAKKCIRKGLKAGAVVMQTAIREVTPVRPDLPSTTALPLGALVNDIEVANIVIENNLAVMIGPGKHTARQARWVEYGHARKGGQVAAHSFIRRAYESAREASTAALVETLAVEIEKSSQGKSS
jgi:hypothetical protein